MAILTIGSRDDPFCRAVAARAGDVPCHSIELEEADAVTLHFPVPPRTGEAYIEHEGTRMVLSELSGIFLRYLGLPPKDDVPDRNYWFVSAELKAFFVALAYRAPCRVVNQVPFDISPFARVEPPLLSALTAELDIAYDEWLVTTAAAPEGVESQTLSYRPLTSPNDEILLNTSNGNDSLTRLTSIMPVRLCRPSHAKSSIYVVGDRAFPMNAGIGDEELASSVALCRALGLTFGRVLWRDADDRVVCMGLETFPIPSADELGSLTPIADALVEELSA